MVGAGGPRTLGRGSDELRVAPSADAGVRNGGEVGAIEGAERGSERAASGIGRVAVLLIGMTVGATGRRGKIGAARDGIRLCRSARAYARERKREREANRLTARSFLGSRCDRRCRYPAW